MFGFLESENILHLVYGSKTLLDDLRLTRISRPIFEIGDGLYVLASTED